MADDAIYAIVDYEDEYVQPLIQTALRTCLPPELLILIKDVSELPSHTTPTLQWRQYESIDFEHLMSQPSTSLANSNVIRKALIRKHYLAATVSHWMAKRPGSELGKHVKPTVEFEVDYAEFLDDALVEAWELKSSWNRNLEKADSESKEWWILKPGMSDRGQGIRLFSSEEDLQSIFEQWDPEDSDEDEADVSDNSTDKEQQSNNGTDGILTSQLRHFIAQAYVDPPLLLSEPSLGAGRKFHIRTYVVSYGALQIYVYKPMLALFAGEAYVPPDASGESPNAELGSHLTNTCLQDGEREGSVAEFWSLPASISPLEGKLDWKNDVFTQICNVTGEIFEAAARSMSIHFQPLPNAFEVFGVDFLVDSEGIAWLLEVNAFPDFKQSGNELRRLVQGLFEGVVDIAITPFFNLQSRKSDQKETMIKVLDLDLGRTN